MNTKVFNLNLEIDNRQYIIVNTVSGSYRRDTKFEPEEFPDIDRQVFVIDSNNNTVKLSDDFTEKFLVTNSDKISQLQLGHIYSENLEARIENYEYQKDARDNR